MDSSGLTKFQAITEKSKLGSLAILDFLVNGEESYIHKEKKAINAMIMNLLHLGRMAKNTTDIFLEYDELTDRLDEKPREGFYLDLAHKSKICHHVLNSPKLMEFIMELLIFSCNYDETEINKKFGVVTGIVDKEWDDMIAAD